MKDFSRRIMLENGIAMLFFDIASKMGSKYKSIQLMRDDDFVHRRNRDSNDIHLFFELKLRGYFHLRGYTRYMLEHLDLVDLGRVYLTGYRKEGIFQIGGVHSFKQDWYDNNPAHIASQIESQNPLLFR